MGTATIRPAVSSTHKIDELSKSHHRRYASRRYSKSAMQKDAETKSGSGIKEASQGIGVDALEIPGGVIERENLNGMFARL
ncbi:hypothetical protein AAMO2058_000055100 [Amorphochlora amoebiformis]